MPRTPTIEGAPPEAHGGRRGVLLHAPYNDEMRTDLRRELPAEDRLWLEEPHAWWVARAHARQLLKIVLRYHPSVLLIGDAGRPDMLVDRDGTRHIQETLAL